MKAMFLSPHPDDVELFCGGTLLRHCRSGDSVQVVMATRGELGTLHPRLRGKGMGEIRRREAEERYAILPGVGLRWLGLPDGKVEVSGDAVELFRELLLEFEPDVLYLPESERRRASYPHPDHHRSGRIAEEALAGSNREILLRYYHSRLFDFFVDVGDFAEENRTAMRHYRSQNGIWADPPFLLPLLSLWQRWRRSRQGRQVGCRCAESFRQVKYPTGSAPNI